ncbi:MAG: BamA/TamA family outer membrane protein [Cyanobacteria bacterium J06614_10]
MRVSPALLACFSLVAISGLPSKAADSSEASSDSATTLEASLDATPQLAVDVAEATADVQSTAPTFSRLLEGVIDQTPPPMLAADKALEEGTTAAQPEAVPLAQIDAVEDAIEDGTEAVEDAAETADEAVEEALEETEDALDASEDAVDDAVEVIPAEETEEDAAPGLPVPSAPNNGVPNNGIPDETPGDVPPEEGVEADEAETDDGAAEEAQEEARVLVAEVDVVSTNERRPLNTELIDAVYRAVETIPGRTTTRSQLQEDINNVFSTGFFSNVRAEPEDTALGVKVTFFVEPNPVLTRVDVRGRQVLDDETVDEIFSPQYGDILNLRDFQNSVLDLNDWYEDNGYVLAQVTAAPQISDDGTVTLIVAEGEIESIDVRYITPDGEATDEEGNPIGGRTRDFIVTREFETEPGDVFQDDAIREDILRAVNLGIFEDIRLSLDPGDEDPRKVKLIVNIVERDTGSIGASLGFNLRGDLFGQLSYNEDNFGGNNQKLRTEGRVTTRGDFLFDVSFTDPWIAGDPFRTSYTASLFNRRATSLIFDNGPIDVELPNGDTPRINRLGTGLSFSRPLDNGLSLSLGGQYERVVVLDSDSDVSPVDELGNQLTASSSGRDDLLTVQFGAVLDRRNNSAQPTSGSLFRLGSEQSVPVGNGNIFFNKLRGSYSQYVPVGFFGDSGRETLAFNVQGGTTIGEIPPYEAFSLGGGNSVRGFEEGAVGAGTSFLQGTVEYRFPLFSDFLGGALFADYGTDLGSGDSVPGDPAGVRGKPGSGFGYGAGVRVQTPLGALRLDYGLSDEGSRFHFGFGERF